MSVGNGGAAIKKQKQTGEKRNMLKVKTYENGLKLVVKKMEGLLSVSAEIGRASCRERV